MFISALENTKQGSIRSTGLASPERKLPIDKKHESDALNDAQLKISNYLQRKRSQGHLEYADQASFDASKDQGISKSFNGSLGGSFTQPRGKAQSFIQTPSKEAKFNAA